mgnify:CR=1 FL=1
MTSHVDRTPAPASPLKYPATMVGVIALSAMINGRAQQKIIKLSENPVIIETWWRSRHRGGDAEFFRIVKSHKQWKNAYAWMVAGMTSLQSIVLELVASNNREFDRIIHGRVPHGISDSRPRVVALLRTILPYLMIAGGTAAASSFVLQKLLKRSMKRSKQKRPVDARGEADILEIEAAGEERTRHGVKWSK